MATQIEKPEICKNEDEVNGDFIYKIAGMEFDGERLFQEFNEITDKFNIDRTKRGQFNLHVRDQAIAAGMSHLDLFFDFSGSLSVTKNHMRNAEEFEFNTIHPALDGTYTKEVIEKVLAFSPNPVGRIRWLALGPKSCYSMHDDPDWYRLHIPMKTNGKAFFVVGEKYYTMPETGSLYVIHPRALHTAVNSALFDTRLHMVFDTAEEGVVYYP